jgi:methyl-accepting chemotaxis protein
MAQTRDGIRTTTAVQSLIGRRILGAFALILAVIIANGAINFLLLDGLNRAAQQERAKTGEQSLLDHLSLVLKNQLDAYNTMVWSRNPLPGGAFLPGDRDSAVVTDIQKLQESYPQLVAAGGPLRGFVENYSHLLEVLQNAAAPVTQTPPDYDAAQAIWRANDSLISGAPKMVDDYRAQVTAERVALGQEQDAASRTAISVSLLVALLSLVLAGGMALLLSRQIVQPVAQLKDALQCVAEGDLSPRTLVTSRDEIGDLLGTFNVTVGKLRDLLAAIQIQALTITSESGQLKEQAFAIGARTTQEAAAVQETLATIDQLSHTAAGIAQAAAAVADSTTQVQEAVADSRRVVMATTHEMNQVRERVGAVSTQIGALAGRTRAIESVLDLMSDVASETHLLALNATIEAAGAGPYGTRFSVIAGQVQELATQANDASDQIRTLIDGVRNAMEETVAIGHAGVAEVDRGVTMVGDLERVHIQIEDLVSRTMDLAYGISLATQQQRDGSNQVVSTVSQLATVAQENQAQSSRTVTSATNLNAVAEYLREAAEQFRLDA